MINRRSMFHLGCLLFSLALAAALLILLIFKTQISRTGQTDDNLSILNEHAYSTGQNQAPRNVGGGNENREYTADNVTIPGTPISSGNKEIVGTSKYAGLNQLRFLETGDYSHFYADGRDVFYLSEGISQMLAGADAHTFVPLSYTPAAGGNDAEWAKDKNHVYFFNWTVDGADPETFQILYKGVMKDKNRVWIEGWTSKYPELELSSTENPLVKANPTEVKSLGYYFFADLTRVYMLHNWLDYSSNDMLRGVPFDLESLIALDQTTLQDDSRIYRIKYSPNYGYSVAIETRVQE